MPARVRSVRIQNASQRLPEPPSSQKEDAICLVKTARVRLLWRGGWPVTRILGPQEENLASGTVGNSLKNLTGGAVGDNFWPLTETFGGI
ncbi:MAG: hypothetical protein JNL67_12645 [Planctomycetaceae bacterium]|nr:hypothetical protein [Planctomycetaceae bacterium]